MRHVQRELYPGRGAHHRAFWLNGTLGSKGVKMTLVMGFGRTNASLYQQAFDGVCGTGRRQIGCLISWIAQAWKIIVFMLRRHPPQICPGFFFAFLSQSFQPPAICTNVAPSFVY